MRPILYTYLNLNCKGLLKECGAKSIRKRMTGKVEKKRVTKKPEDSGRKGVYVVRKKREVFEGGEKSKQKRRGSKLPFTRGTLEQGYFLRNKRRNKPNKLHLQKSVYIEGACISVLRYQHLIGGLAVYAGHWRFGDARFLLTLMIITLYHPSKGFSVVAMFCPQRFHGNCCPCQEVLSSGCMSTAHSRRRLRQRQVQHNTTHNPSHKHLRRMKPG